MHTAALCDVRSSPHHFHTVCSARRYISGAQTTSRGALKVELLRGQKQHTHTIVLTYASLQLAANHTDSDFTFHVQKAL